MKDIEKLKDIFLSKDIDDEDYQENLDQINEWEKSLIENENLLGWQEHDITKQVLTQVRESYIEISLRLATQREIEEHERISLWAKQDAMLWLLSLASNEPKVLLEKIENDIRKALNP